VAVAAAGATVSARAEERAYWDGVGERLRGTQGASLARLYSDEVHRQLIARWWPDRPVRSVLKTDLFEEACGDGLAGLLTARARTVVAIDLASRTAAAARARHPRLAVVESDVRALPFRAESFDLVVSTSTLDHVASGDEITTSLAEIARMLRPRGTLILTLDNPANPLLVLRRAAPLLWWRLGVVPYRLGATLRSTALRDAIEGAGLRATEVAAVLHAPRFPADLASRWLRGKRDAAADPLSRRLVRGLMRFERLGSWPTRFLTGHFVAVRAVRD
jgi:SAM-dependent methyltransferase